MIKPKRYEITLTEEKGDKLLVMKKKEGKGGSNSQPDDGLIF